MKVFTDELDHRRSFIGGSDARVIMGDDERALLRLWREKRGEIEPEDLSDNLVVQIGAATEDINRRWFERNTGKAVTYVRIPAIVTTRSDALRPPIPDDRDQCEGAVRCIC